MNLLTVIGCVLFLVCLISCTSNQVDEFVEYPRLMEIPKGFDPIPQVQDNDFTYARWELGKKLFFDEIMSRDNSISCASCHQPNLSFSDNQKQSFGVEGRIGKRNAPSLANVAYHPYLTREGGVPTLEMQVLVPLQEHDEFDFNIVDLSERLLADDEYTEMSYTAYDRPPDPYVITRALACFERSLISGNSFFDQFTQHDILHVMNEKAQKGMDLFFSSRTQCAACHGGFNFTNYAFENNGLHEEYEDPGRFRLTQKDSDKGMFKVPSLRNIAMTAPYMHDGSLPSLRAVIEHYNKGGAHHPNKSKLIKKLNLSEEEKQHLILFLESLTDRTFIENPNFQEN